jgi:hypothetical protein
MINSFTLRGQLRSVEMNAHLDSLTRTNDPFLEKRLIGEIRAALQKQAPKSLSYTLSPEILNRYTQTYGEQYVVDASLDLARHFDIVNRRFFSRLIPTQLAALYLFGGGGKSYRPNITSVSAAGEGLAGYCMEQFGFSALVRPLCVMPDIVLSTERGGETLVALVEAKASVSKEALRLLEENISKFLLDIKTRASGFKNHYEGYLFCIRFEDGGRIDCACLHVDLKYYCHAPASAPIHISVAPAPLDRPAERLRDFIRLQAETVETRDAYLAALISEEATRSATFALMKEEKIPKTATDVDRQIWIVAEELGLRERWRQGQDLIKQTKSREHAEVEQAIQLSRKPIEDERD